MYTAAAVCQEFVVQYRDKNPNGFTMLLIAVRNSRYCILILKLTDGNLNQSNILRRIAENLQKITSPILKLSSFNVTSVWHFENKCPTFV